MREKNLRNNARIHGKVRLRRGEGGAKTEALAASLGPPLDDRLDSKMTGQFGASAPPLAFKKEAFKRVIFQEPPRPEFSKNEMTRMS